MTRRLHGLFDGNIHDPSEILPIKPAGSKRNSFRPKVVKLELMGGEAKPGPKLASAGIVMPKFCTDFNAKTADRKGEIVPVIITAYEDKSFDFVIKTSPVAGLLLKAAGVAKGSSNSKTTKVGHISKDQLRQIAEYKMPDLNCNDIEAAMNIIAGSARNMGITIDD